LKPCDSYSFNQLLTEHRFDREKVYAVGIPCEGMADINKVRQAVDGIAKLTFDENGILTLKLDSRGRQGTQGYREARHTGV